MSSHAPFATEFAHTIYRGRYPLNDQEAWSGTAARVVENVIPSLREAPNGSTFQIGPVADDLFASIDARKFIPGGRYLYASGRDLHQVNNCLLLRCRDSREGWADTGWQSEMALMTGAGIGVYYGDVRGSGSIIRRTGGVASGPIAKMNQINETGRNTMQGGARRSAIWAGLPWWHPDIFEFIRVKDWPQWLRDQKSLDPNTPAPLDMTNISVCLDDDFFFAYEGGGASGIRDELDAPSGSSWHDWATAVYDLTVKKMVTTGEPGFSVDLGDKKDEVLRNACTEITSADDSDVCNLGSLVLPRYETPLEFGEAVRDAALFLTAGSLYSDVPYGKVDEIRQKNRRLGLGLIGVHEFCLNRGVAYGSDDSFEALEPFMLEYDRALEYAWDWQDKLGLSRSVAATAIAPNGTIGIIAESTPSGDPLFAAAWERTVVSANAQADIREKHIYVDPIAKRMVENGVDPDSIEDAYSLSLRPDLRLEMQAFLQSHVDQAVSSTVNLPKILSDPRDQKDFGETLMRYLPRLRGITAYPDGARAGQPLKAIPLSYALEHEGEVTIATEEETCAGGICGV